MGEDHVHARHLGAASDGMPEEAAVVGDDLQVQTLDAPARAARARLVRRQLTLGLLEGREGRVEYVQELRRRQQAPSGPSAKTASPSISWISSGGASRRITASSRAPMICGPCSSSTAVTNAVKPEMSARTRTPCSAFMPVRPR